MVELQVKYLGTFTSKSGSRTTDKRQIRGSKPKETKYLTEV